MNPTHIAWAAGLFEGEGCITFRDKKHNQPYLKMSMTDFDVVRKFHGMLGGSLDTIDKKNPQWKDQLQWRIGGRENVKRILELFLPHFGDRRAHKALDVLDLIECKQ